MSFPTKGSACDYALAFFIVVTTLLIATTIAGYTDVSVLLQFIPAFK